MSRIAHRSIVSLAIVSAVVCTGTPGAQAKPPTVAGLAAQVSALQAQVTGLTAQVTTLQDAVTTLQGTAGGVQVWQNASVARSVQRNDATNVSDWTLSTLASLSLPAGTFFVEAKTSVQDPDISASTFFCFLTRSAGSIDESVDNSTQDEPATIALQGVVTLSSPDTVALKCGASGPAATPGSAETFVSKLVAIKASLQ
jgi:hypothetical protein